MIDRIDFFVLSDGRVNILKLTRLNGDGQPPRDVRIPDGQIIHPHGFDLESALAWCEANGFVVRRWRSESYGSGARAWKGDKPWVIRSKGQIQRKRRKNPLAVNMDFAYDG